MAGLKQPNIREESFSQLVASLEPFVGDGNEQMISQAEKHAELRKFVKGSLTLKGAGALYDTLAPDAKPGNPSDVLKKQHDRQALLCIQDGRDRRYPLEQFDPTQIQPLSVYPDLLAALPRLFSAGLSDYEILFWLLSPQVVDKQLYIGRAPETASFSAGLKALRNRMTRRDKDGEHHQDQTVTVVPLAALNNGEASLFNRALEQYLGENRQVMTRAEKVELLAHEAIDMGLPDVAESLLKRAR